MMNFFLVSTFLFVYFYTKSYCSIFLSSNGSVIFGRKLLTVFNKRPYAAFCNIPYAEPPVRNMRFKPPKERKFFTDNRVYDFSEAPDDTCSIKLNEDCLYLSIYMPISRNITNFSVLVWIRENSNFHGPDFFIEEDILVVTVSFRTSIFGFLCTGDKFAAGNMGAKDVLMALKWIKFNINLFLGDPTKVTVAGSGVGSTIAASLILLETSEDLFTRVIVLSGSALSPADYRPYNFEIERKLYNRLSGSRHKFQRERFYEILKNVSTVKLDSVSRGLFDSTEVRNSQRQINSFSCIVETSTKQPFMCKSPLDMYGRKIKNNVGVMFGFKSLESLSNLAGFASNRKLLNYLNYNFQYLLPFEGKRPAFNSKWYKSIERRLKAFYFSNGTIGERSLRRYAKYHSDQVVYPLLRQASLHCEASCNNVYLYRFGFKGAFNIGWKSSVPNLNWTAATMGDEICYLFRCKSVNDVYNSEETTAERHFIIKLVRLIGNYVKHGIPTPNDNDNVLGVLKWEPLQRGHKLKGMSLTSDMKMIYLPEEKRMRFWDQLKNNFFSDNIIKDE